MRRRFPRRVVSDAKRVMRVSGSSWREHGSSEMRIGARGRGSWRGPRRLGGIARLVVLFSVAAAFIGGVVSSSSAAGTPLGTHWDATGSGSTTVVSDGTSGPAEFNYFFDPTPGANGVGVSGNWQFATTAVRRNSASQLVVHRAARVVPGHCEAGRGRQREPRRHRSSNAGPDELLRRHRRTASRIRAPRPST